MMRRMDIHSAIFIKGIVGPDTALKSNFPQIAFIGRSNVGKSTFINTLTQQKNLARTSNFPGRTQEINLFLINGNTHFLDLPGYGFAKVAQEQKSTFQDRIAWYLFESEYTPKWVVLIVDANIGPTPQDLEMYDELKRFRHKVLVIANKIDKIKKAKLHAHLGSITDKIEDRVIPFSSEKKIGLKDVRSILFS
jgi:GTP-binding protein